MTDAIRKNWLAEPVNRDAFVAVESVAHCLTIPADGAAEMTTDLGPPLKDAALLSEVEATFTDALIVVRHGVTELEWYAPHTRATDRHLLMSISKSLTALVCGVLEAEGVLSTDDTVITHLPELSGTTWDGCTIQHLLDMRTGVAWDYDRDEEDIFDVSDYRIHNRHDLADGTAAWIRSIERSSEPGGSFEYASLVSDVLAWVLERAGGRSFHELVSLLLWQPMGARTDGSIIVDRYGFPVAEGGISTTARDLSSIGVMMLNNGRADTRQVVPTAWVRELRTQNLTLIDAFRNAPEADPTRPLAFYHNNWWVEDAEAGVYSALGIHGQTMLVHHPTDTVVVKLSSQPSMEDSEMVKRDIALTHVLATASYRGA